MSDTLFTFFRQFQSAEYTRISSELEHERPPSEKTSSAHRQPTWRSWFPLLGMTLLCLLTAIGGFTLGFHVKGSRDSLPAWAQSMPRAPIDIVQQIWEYDRSFGVQPPVDNSTEAEWDALIPKGQGFVRYPANAKHISAISAVHQLHCLYSIRRALFAEPGVPIAGINMEHLKPPHMRHCFDYLRQALLCSADSTLEPFRTDLGGVTGWGFPRVCRNYEQLREWAESRRTNDREGFVEVVTHAHPVKSSKDNED
ncbi:hypothetical protein MMC19_003517 [Ptychographa xylographoides]|nr:hypothetical protein [Ptychographa xylographoides]